MNRAIKLLNDEEGSLIIFTLMVLALLTLVGMSGIRNANTELEIAGSELIYQTNFYLAEGAAIDAVDQLENTLNPLTTPPDWLQTTPGVMNEENYTDPGYPEGTPTSNWDVADHPQNDTFFKAAYEGITAGSSEDMSKSKLHDFTIYGRSENERGGVSEIRIGYRKVF